jgi:hypothetical protein
VIDSISDKGQRGEALVKLADALARHNEHKRVLNLVHRWWRQADTRNEAIHLLPLAFGFIPLHPNIGIAFSDALVNAVGRDTVAVLQQEGDTVRPVYTGQKAGFLVDVVTTTTQLATIAWDNRAVAEEIIADLSAPQHWSFRCDAGRRC